MLVQCRDLCVSRDRGGAKDAEDVLVLFLLLEAPSQSAVHVRERDDVVLVLEPVRVGHRDGMLRKREGVESRECRKVVVGLTKILRYPTFEHSLRVFVQHIDLFFV